MSRSLRSCPHFDLLLIGGLILVLQIPISMIRGVIAERERNRGAAVEEVTRSWGGRQVVTGPVLHVPVRKDAAESSAVGVTVLPASLSIESDVRATPLRRGLFTVPAYRATVELRGSFEDPRGDAIGRGELDWANATLSLGISDPRSVGAASGVSWNAEQRELLPGPVDPDRGASVQTPVVVGASETHEFVVTLELSGSSSLLFTPVGRHTEAVVRSDWSSPSFTGNWLPRERSVGDEGFTAEWAVSFLGRGYPQSWAEGERPHVAIDASRFGIDFITPVDPYRMSERSTKYAPLFLVFTFGVLWLFRVTAGLRLHAVHYLLVGAAMCLFYLLELALAEQIGFTNAYVVAAAAVTLLVAGYAKAVLQSTARAGSLGGSMALIYGYLLALLALEQYALLAGSLGLFAALAAVMYATRWIDWDAIGGDPRPAEHARGPAP